MAYESRAYDNQHGEPVVVLVTTGRHDVSRLLNLLAGSVNTIEQMKAGVQIRSQVKRHSGGRAALALLKAHGGPDFTTDREQPPAPHTVTVTQLALGFDPDDVREHEYLLYSGPLAPVSHLVAHPPACDELPYGRLCWFDEMFQGDGHTYDGTPPSTYSALPEVEQFAHPETGEILDERRYIHYGPVEPKAAG